MKVNRWPAWPSFVLLPVLVGCDAEATVSTDVGMTEDGDSVSEDGDATLDSQSPLDETDATTDVAPETIADAVGTETDGGVDATTPSDTLPGEVISDSAIEAETDSTVIDSSVETFADSTADSDVALVDTGGGSCAKGWTAMAATPPAFAARGSYSAVWTGSKMVVWGGASKSTGTLKDGAAYDRAANTWVMLSTSPLTPRGDASAVWTGSKMILWGGCSSAGYENDGSAYDPAKDAWSSIAPSGLSGRCQHSAVWTGSEMIVWGGTNYGPEYSNGARYDPASDTWTALPAVPSGFSARHKHAAVWIGSKMLVWGGSDGISSLGLRDGAAYDRATNSWTLMAAPPSLVGRRIGIAFAVTGPAPGRFATWGGSGEDIAKGSTGFLDNGAIYDPIADTWSLIASPGDLVLLPAHRVGVGAWWDGSRFNVFGGGSIMVGGLDNGASYDPASASWTPLPTSSSSPSRRYAPTAFWTGTEAIVWGGSDTTIFSDGGSSTTYLNDGSIYCP